MYCNVIYLLINVNCNDISLLKTCSVKKYHYLCIVIKKQNINNNKTYDYGDLQN